ncbi:MAG: hypothetical protein LLF28_05345 [Nitrospiraceae bacterium]|nr:hypothetical protein [Nitrospiraceae bacterium]
MRIKQIIIIFIIAFFVIGVLGIHDSYARKTAKTVNPSKARTVEGIIEYTGKDFITIKGKNYYIPNSAQLLNPSGGKLDKSAFQNGRKVTIFFKHNNITSVVIHEKALAE